MIYCPDCREEIPVEDFNVSTDIAFCRRCGKNHRYSELADFEVRAGFRPDRPPRGMRVLPDDGTGEGIVFRYYGGMLAFFLCLYRILVRYYRSVDRGVLECEGCSVVCRPVHDSVSVDRPRVSDRNSDDAFRPWRTSVPGWGAGDVLRHRPHRPAEVLDGC